MSARLHLAVLYNFLLPLVLTIFMTAGAVGGERTVESAPDSVANRLVQAALQLELEGDQGHRQLALQTALSTDPDCGPARWQLGQLKHQGKWASVADAMESQALDTTLAAYRAKRATIGESPSRELELARWSMNQGMESRARAHLHRVATHQDATPRERKLAVRELGLRTIDGVTLDKWQWQRQQAAAAELERSQQAWLPVVKRWAKTLTKGRLKGREHTLAQLYEVNDPSAIAAIESELSLLDEEVASAVVRTLQQIPSHLATTSLARQALRSPWETVSQQAAQALSDRPEHEYIPQLLNRLLAPLGTDARIVADRDEVRIERITYTEGIAGNRANYSTMRTSDGLSSRNAFSVGLARFRANQAMQRQDSEIEQYNASAKLGNRRVFDVLATATKQDLPAQPAMWWDWWHQHNDVFSGRSTEVSYETYAYEDAPIDDAAYESTLTIGGGGECFVAGTLVWTETGLQSIETVAPGDLVLSQHQQTGELAYKVVLERTKREPQKLVAVQLHGERLVSTQGHPLWVNGIGWRMAKLIEPHDYLHTTSGGVEVQAVELLPQPAEVYNLVVDEFANYFVGTHGVLAHDNTYREPTTCAVPGLLSPKTAASR